MACAISAIVVADVVTVSMVAAAVTEVGVITSLVGMVTKNKTLTEIGGVMALAGGIGGLAAGAATGVADAAIDTGAAATTQAGEDAAYGAAMNTPTDLSSQVGSGASNLDGSPVIPNNPSPLDGTPAPTTTTTANAPASTPTAPTSNTATPSIPNPSTASTTAPNANTSATTLTPPSDTKDPGWFTKYFGSLTDGQGRALSGAMQLGGSALNGLMSGWTEEQKQALLQQQQNLSQSKYDTQVANASGQPKIAYAPVNTPVANGLVNSTPIPKVGA